MAANTCRAVTVKNSEGVMRVISAQTEALHLILSRLLILLSYSLGSTLVIFHISHVIVDSDSQLAVLAQDPNARRIGMQPTLHTNRECDLLYPILLTLP